MRCDAFSGVLQGQGISAENQHSAPWQRRFEARFHTVLYQLSNAFPGS
jgi:hypothetical protein